MELANILSEWLEKLRKGDFRELKSWKAPGKACPRTPLKACAFGSSLGNRPVFLLDPRLKEATILTFYILVFSLAISFSLKEFFFVLHNDLSCMLINFWEPSPVQYSDLIYFMSLSPDLTAPYWAKTVLIVGVEFLTVLVC